MWLLNLPFQKHGNKAFIPKVLDRIKALCRSVKVFPNQQGRAMSLWSCLCVRGHYHVEKKKGFAPQTIATNVESHFPPSGPVVFWVTPSLSATPVLRHQLSHTEIQSLICPQNWQDTVLLAPSSEVSSHTPLHWWAAMPNKLDWEVLAQRQQAAQTDPAVHHPKQAM